MSRNRARRRRAAGLAATRIVVAVAVVLALQALLFLAAERGQRSGRGTMPFSSFRPDDSGLRAARLVLDEIGLPVESRRGAKLPEGTGHVLIRVGVRVPTDQRPDEELVAERRELAAWVTAGNAVLLFGDGDEIAAATPFLTPAPGDTSDDDEAEQQDEDEDEDDDQESDEEPAEHGEDGEYPDDGSEADVDLLPLLPEVRGESVDPDSVLQNMLGETARQVAKGPEVAMSRIDVVVLTDYFEDLDEPWIARGRYVDTSPADDVWVRAAGSTNALVVQRELGNGYAVVVADPFFASNLRLARSDNAAWIATIVSRVRGRGSVWFDDRAVGQSASRGVLSLVTERGLGAALLCGLGLLLLVWWRSGPSDAPEESTRPRPEYQPASYAHLRAGLYVDCIGESDIRRVVRDEVRRRLALGERTGFERALDMLGTHHPERADGVRNALAELPSDPQTTYRKHPDTWTRAVALVWRALEQARPERAQPADGEDSHGTAR